MKTRLAVVTLASAVLLVAHGRAQGPMIEWPFYGGQQAHTKYSAAADITPENVSRLMPAWQWEPVTRFDTPYSVNGAPMTYRSRAGRQFVVVATGGGSDATLTAFALPDGSAPVQTAAAGASRGSATVPVAAAQSGSPVAQGQAAFDRVCKACHGPEARGDAGPRLVPFSREYEELLGIVREGTGQMPPISVRELPDEGVAQIVPYLKSLSR